MRSTCAAGKGCSPCYDYGSSDNDGTEIPREVTAVSGCENVPNLLVPTSDELHVAGNMAETLHRLSAEASGVELRACGHNEKHRSRAAPVARPKWADLSEEGADAVDILVTDNMFTEDPEFTKQGTSWRMVQPQ